MLSVPSSPVTFLSLEPSTVFTSLAVAALFSAAESLAPHAAVAMEQVGQCVTQALKKLWTADLRQCLPTDDPELNTKIDAPEHADKDTIPHDLPKEGTFGDARSDNKGYVVRHNTVRWFVKDLGKFHNAPLHAEAVVMASYLMRHLSGSLFHQIIVPSVRHVAGQAKHIATRAIGNTPLSDLILNQATTQQIAAGIAFSMILGRNAIGFFWLRLFDLRFSNMHVMQHSQNGYFVLGLVDFDMLLGFSVEPCHAGRQQLLAPFFQDGIPSLLDNSATDPQYLYVMTFDLVRGLRTLQQLTAKIMQSWDIPYLDLFRKQLYQNRVDLLWLFQPLLASFHQDPQNPELRMPFILTGLWQAIRNRWAQYQQRPDITTTLGELPRSKTDAALPPGCYRSTPRAFHMGYRNPGCDAHTGIFVPRNLSGSFDQAILKEMRDHGESNYASLYRSAINLPNAQYNAETPGFSP